MAAAAAVGGGDVEESLRKVIIENFVSCSICLLEYKDPTDLPCKHTFCKGCLQTLISDLTPGSKFSCPLCQEKITVPKDGVNGFTHNFFIESLQDTVLMPVSKKNCNCCFMVSQTETVATSKCITCHDYLCEKCSTFHCGTRLTKDHRVLTFQQLSSDEYQKEIQDQQKFFCQEHKDEIIRYFCPKCRTPICRDCKDLHHDGHKLISIENAAEVVKTQLKSRLDILEKKIESVAENFTKTDEMLTTLTENEKSTKQEIEARAAHLHHLVDQRKKTLLGELHQTSSAHREKLHIFHEKCHATSSSINSTRDAIKQVLELGAPVDVLMLQQPFGQRLDDLQSKSDVDEIPDVVKITLSTNTDVDREISSGKGLGSILISKQPTMPWLKPMAERIQEFNTGCKGPTGISVSPSAEYVTIHGEHNKVHVFSSDGTPKKNISNASGTALRYPTDICPFPDGRMILSDKDNNKLFILSPKHGTHMVQQIVEVNGPWGVALNNDCTKIAVAQGDQESVSVFSININGEINLTDVIKDRNGRPVFSDAYKVAYMRNGCLVVADTLQNMVHILNPSGDPQYQYTGHDNKPLYPCGVCVDVYDNILVTDHDNHCIHMVSPDGKFIQYIATKADGLQNPWACTINQDGNLVVTEEKGKVKVFKYLDK